MFNDSTSVECTINDNEAHYLHYLSLHAVQIDHGNLFVRAHHY